MDKETGHRRERRGRPYWEAQIEAWRRSGLTQAEYCRREGIVAQQFANWKSRLGTETAMRGFVELPAQSIREAMRPHSAPLVEITLDDELHLTLALRLRTSFLRVLFGGGA